MEQKTIILLTAAMRLDNLPVIARSILKQRIACKRYGFNLHWCICIDKANAYAKNFFEPNHEIKIGDYNEDNLPEIQKVIGYRLLDMNGIDGSVFISGEYGQKNYGGDLFNGPLAYLKQHKFQDSNPLVYILDDDNIIHPFLLHTIRLAIDFVPNCENKFLWLTKMSGYGYTAEAWRDNAYARIDDRSGDNWRCYEVFSADPSQMVQWLDQVMSWQPISGKEYPGAGEHGMFPNGFQYDSRLYLGQWDQNKDNFVFFPEWLQQNFIHDLPATYHNGLVTDEELADIQRSMNEYTCAMHLTVTTTDGKQRMIPINDSDFIWQCMLKDRQADK